MAAPTNVRVYATSTTTATICWTYPGANTIDVYRSTDGISYSIVVNIANGTTCYDDTGLSDAVKYWYKLSDDGGATFSSVVTVVTHSCPAATGDPSSLALPRFDGSEQQADSLNELAQKLEDALKNDPDSGVVADCEVCINDGAIVIECGAKCDHYVVIVTEDINSISLHNCEDTNPTISFVVPPNTTHRVCGWPPGFGFSGDECFNAPIAGGANGRYITANSGSSSPGTTRPKPGGTGGGTGGSLGSGGCACVPNGEGNPLTIKSCDPNNSLGCSASSGGMTVLACGGRPPYTWSLSVGSTLTLNKTTGTSVRVSTSPNTGSAVAGTAYTKVTQFCRSNQATPGDCGGGGSVTIWAYQDFGCNDQSIGSCIQDGTHSGCGAAFDNAAPCKSGTCNQSSPGGALTCATGPCAGSPAWPAGASSGPGCGSGATCDRRTAPMIAASCSPCGVQAVGQVITVTDDAGTSVSLVIRA